MIRRPATFATLVFCAAVLLAAGLTGGIQAQQGPARPSAASAAVPRTPWGDPDLQGVWSSDSEAGVPFERPAELGEKASLSAEELEQVLDEREEQRAERAPTLGGVTGAGPTHWFEDWGQKSSRTSLVIDPPNGRVPPLTPEAQRAGRGFGGGGSFGGGPFNSYTDFATWDRCITRGVPAVMFPMIYNNNSRITQAPGFVAITYEMVHETRIIPLDRRPHLGEGLRQWLGDPRGYWDGDTLVIESTNFSNKTNYRGSGETLKLVERFRRIDGKGLRYEVTIDDPKTFTRPWTAALNLQPAVEMYEYACHEGNYAMRNMLSAARAAERAAAGGK
jgi:hypothetical protein